MPYYKKCEICGANLDPNEKCTCREEIKAEQIEKEVNQMVQATLKVFEYSRNKKRGKRK